MKLDLGYRSGELPADRAASETDIVDYAFLAERAADSFESFVRFMHPEWNIPLFHLRMIEILDLLEARQLSLNYDVKGYTAIDRNPVTGPRAHKIMLNMPPRHSKSTLGTILFNAWCIGRDMGCNTMTATYNTLMATDFGKQTRAVVSDPRFKQVFPHFQLDQSSRSSEMWGPVKGGGRAFFIGFDGTASGRGANVLICDDAIKNRSEAESVIIKNLTWSNYTSTMRTRLEPDKHGRPPIEIMTQTRWAEDDLCGRVAATNEFKEQWVHVNFKGYDEKTGRSLWPAMFPPEAFKALRKLSPRDYFSLIQQSPFVEGGSLIKRHWFGSIDEPRSDYRIKIITVDPAATAKTSSDPSAMLVLGLTEDGMIDILGKQASRVEFPELKKQLIVFANLHNVRTVYIEDKSSGHALRQALSRETSLAVMEWRVNSRTGDKTQRLTPYLPLLEAGTVRLLAMHDWEDFLKECERFPAGAHDDMVDCLSMGLAILSRMGAREASVGGFTLENIMKDMGKTMRGRAGLPEWRGWGM